MSKTNKKPENSRTIQEHKNMPTKHKSKSKPDMNKPRTQACWKSITKQQSSIKHHRLSTNNYDLIKIGFGAKIKLWIKTQKS